MIRFTVFSILATAALWGATAFTGPGKETAAFKAKHFIILVIDGPRFSETFGDPTHQLIPHLYNDLAPQGTLYNNFRNNGRTFTISGHTAICTGHYQTINNGGSVLPKRPNIFQYYLKTTNVDKDNAWVITSKGKLEVLANTKKKGWFNTYMPATYCGPNGNGASYGGDEFTMQKVKHVLDTYHPTLMLINLLEVDTHGHANDWEGYKTGIRNCDEHAYTLWNWIQSDPQLKDQTALFITNDHGRHLDGHKSGFVSHGDNCEGCRHITLLGLGPDFAKGRVVEKGGEQIDISTTIASMMNFQMPTSDGRFLKDLFN